MKIILPFCLCFLIFCSFLIDDKKGLKDFYKSYYPIGVAVSPNSLKGESGKFIISQFNSITAENAMKWDLYIPHKIDFFG